MPFCTKCGAQLAPENKFCISCGTPTAAIVPMTPTYRFDLHEGTAHEFPLLGETLTITPGMDIFNHYRKEFRKIARQQAAALRSEYCVAIHNLDQFFTDFPDIYRKHRKPLLDAAMDLLTQAEIYDVSPQQFEDEHTEDFCLCSEDVDVLIESFNATIEANQERKARKYDMMPGMIFSGLGGFAAALAVNVAVNKIAEADIRNADVTPAQRAEIYGRLNFDLLMERAYIDYWRVFLSLTWTMKEKGLPVWYPTESQNQSAEGLLQNLSAGRIPQDKVPAQLVKLLQLNPYVEDHMTYVANTYGITAETRAIFDYFGFDPANPE